MARLSGRVPRALALCFGLVLAALPRGAYISGSILLAAKCFSLTNLSAIKETRDGVAAPPTGAIGPPPGSASGPTRRTNHARSPPLTARAGSLSAARFISVPRARGRRLEALLLGISPITRELG